MTASARRTAPRIVYLDEPTYITAGFLTALARLGSVQVYYDRPGPEEATRRLVGTDVAVVEWTRLTREILCRAEGLGHVATVLSATDQVDLTAARELGISVSHCPRYSIDSVADHLMSCAATLLRRLLPAHAAAGAGVQHRYVPYLGREPRGLVLGLLGTGHIGRAVAARAAQLGMRVIGTNGSGKPVPGIETVSLEELVRRCDVLSVQVPARPETTGLLSADLVTLLRPGAVVLSVSRHSVIDTDALLHLHRAGGLGGVALDDPPAHLVPEFAKVPNTLLTPGIAWYTDRARKENLHEVLGNIRSHLSGGNRNAVV
ncbi:NAD(P)-dependent oxidoreductase [Streptomyces sp. NPDC059740]|uniref:NAD(P)-dependent oxidoreductase n=1 Tax=Streptomyces sp. NPDC059740 TaxID=3346926 RepID=UPI003663B214